MPNRTVALSRNEKSSRGQDLYEAALKALCRVLDVAHSGYYASLEEFCITSGHTTAKCGTDHQKWALVDFLESTLKALPYRVHTVLTDNGIQFTKKQGTEAYRVHPFDALCRQHGIEHRLTKPCHPWTNGQVERMNRTIKEATTKVFHYASLEELRSHLRDYLWAYNSARPLRALKGRTPVGFILEEWHKDPQNFIDDPGHYFPGPKT